MQVLSDTSVSGVPINSRIMFTFLQACWGATFTREQVARVFAEVAAMRAHRQPDQSVFAALLTFAQRHLPEHAVGVWTALQEVSYASYLQLQTSKLQGWTITRSSVVLIAVVIQEFFPAASYFDGPASLRLDVFPAAMKGPGEKAICDL